MLITDFARAVRGGECYEAGGEHWRLWIGDLAWWNENEGGEREGSKITLEVGFGDHIGDYDTEHDWPKPSFDDRRYFLTRWITVMIGRWGFTFNWRGREITGTDWDIPRWKLDGNGELLEEWR